MSDEFVEGMHNLKQVIIVRTDLEMTKGKIAAQVAHASLRSAMFTMERHPMHFWNWFRDGNSFKIVLKVKTMWEIMDIARRAEAAGMPHSVMVDRGYTQVPADTTTCIALGPAPAKEIDAITGALKLL